MTHIHQTHPNQTVVVVSHGGFIGCFLEHIRNGLHVRIDNCCLSIVKTPQTSVDVDSNGNGNSSKVIKWETELVNDGTHFMKVKDEEDVY
jgi:broad specificity phosphatase PhoE